MARPRQQDRSAVLSKGTLIMATQAQRKRWEQAAQKHGYTLSAWARAMLDRAARTG